MADSKDTTNNPLLTQESAYAFVPVYKPSTPTATTTTTKPTNLNLNFMLIGGLLLAVVGTGSTLFNAYQKNQNVDAQVQMAVSEALAKQQDSIAQCMNRTFERNNGGNYRR